jgi:monoamine oxidase
MTTRRQFIRTVAGAAAGTVLAPNVFTQRKQKTCVVIGAGFSGLAAAYKLKNAGWKVTVVEARNRIGGRVFSAYMWQNPSLVFELGAEWVGESHERIKALCHDFNIPLQRHQFDDYLLRDGHVYRPGEWGFSPQAKAAFEKLIAGYEKLTPLAKAKLDKYDWWTYLEKIGFTPDDLRLRDLMDSTDFGESIRHVSAFAALAEYAESSTHNEMDYKMTGGNSRLAEELAKLLGSENLRMSTRVQEIKQSAKGVTVSGYFVSPPPAGTQALPSKFELSADAVVCTVPINSLLKIKFDPPLPPAQQDAAERLTYARICKNSVLYDERFWKAENFSMVSDVTSHYYFHSTQGQAGKQGVLTSYAIGEKADVLASQSDERRMRIIGGDLIDLNSNAPRLARGIASYAWQRDEFTDGAYALYKPGQWFGIRPILARPHGKVMFAGEHLADWQGFMEGAIETGEAAATALIR